MMKLEKILTVAVVTTALSTATLATGCAADDVEADDTVNQSSGEQLGTVQGAITVAGWPQLPLCTFLNRGGVYYVKSDKRLLYCDGGEYSTLDLSGYSGKDGVSWLVTTAAATTAQCPSGGVVIQIGPDANHDGLIDAVRSSTPVCNGAVGPQGPAGGKGANGANGSVIRQSVEPAGLHCAHGGTKIESGVDDNANGQLDVTEVDETTYVCGQVAAPACQAGSHACGGANGTTVCADDTSPLTCGSSCTACAGATGQVPSCSAGACGFRTCDVTSWMFLGGSLSYCSLGGANLMDANFSESTLWFANFRGANLDHADFTGAVLNHTDFTGSNLASAKFSGANTSALNAITDSTTICPNGQHGPCSFTF